MQRQEQIKELALEFLKEKMQKTISRVTLYYKEHKAEIEKEFFDTVSHGLCQCLKRGKRVGYVTISILESSLITETYDLQLAFYDKNLYADDAPVFEYWAPVFLFAELEHDMDALQNFLKTRVVRLKSYEINDIQMEYAVNFYFLLSFMLRELAKKIFLLPDFIEVEKEEQVKILLGKYMERQTELAVWEAEE